LAVYKTIKKRFIFQQNKAKGCFWEGRPGRRVLVKEPEEEEEEG